MGMWFRNEHIIFSILMCIRNMLIEVINSFTLNNTIIQIMPTWHLEIERSWYSGHLLLCHVVHHYLCGSLVTFARSVLGIKTDKNEWKNLSTIFISLFYYEISLFYYKKWGREQNSRKIEYTENLPEYIII